MNFFFAEGFAPYLFYAERKAQAAFAFAFVCMAALGIISNLSLNRLRENAERTSRSEEAISSLRFLLSNVTDAETAQRGYAITGEESYLEPYYSARQTVQTDL
jgi:CHASE3 domain sensor protein